MNTLHTLLLALIIGVGYFFFFHATPASAPAAAVVATVPRESAKGLPESDSPRSAHDPFKESMDRAHAVANQMKAAHAESNSL